jgi:hypothetical protein
MNNLILFLVYLQRKMTMPIDHATEAAIHELISTGNLEELRDLLNAMDENRA